MVHSPFDIYRLILVIFVSLYLLAALAGMLWSRTAQGSRVASRGLRGALLILCARTHRRDLAELAGLAIVLALLVIVQL